MRYKLSGAVAMFLTMAVLGAISQWTTSTQSLAQGSCRSFTETGKQVCGRFLEYWTAKGGLAQQGFPLSNEFTEISKTDGKPYVVQYFERAVFEKHPENAPPNDVLLSLLGNFSYKQKYPSGAQGQTRSTQNPRVFNETGKAVGGVRVAP
jgi:hypothetical protein